MMNRPRNERHGGSYSYTYKSWRQMISRCNGWQSEANKNIYKNVDCCKEWRLFSNFAKDMGERPKDYVLDRIDNSKGYFKENCRWANVYTSNMNKRSKKRSLPRGVYKVKSGYESKIGITGTGTTLSLGTYKTIKEAEHTFLSTYIEWHGVKPYEYSR